MKVMDGIVLYRVFFCHCTVAVWQYYCFTKETFDLIWFDGNIQSVLPAARIGQWNQWRVD